jgi:sugar phosphate isomerase/epimerase
VKLAVSNIALTAFDHAKELARLPALGIEAVEVAPSRAWRDTWKGLSGADVARYRKTIEQAGLAVVGLHSLFFDQPRLGLFKAPMERAESLDFLEHLSRVCRDLGGSTLIWGGGRKRDRVSEAAARVETITFMEELLPRVEHHGTCFCFEPLGPNDSDFINSALDSLAIVKTVASPGLKVQLDAKALVENEEATIETFRAVARELVHFHANQPGLDPLALGGPVDHAGLGAMLRDIGYDGFVSIEQRMLNALTPIDDIVDSVRVLHACYRDGG